MTEKGIVFFPDPFLEATPRDVGISGYEDIFFETEDSVRLHGWFIDAPEKRTVMLWFHGNAGNISHRLENISMLHESLQVPIFIFDYREYGLSEGTITKEGTFLDAVASYKLLTEKRSIDPGSILLFGRSLGSALAVFIASKHPCLGLILEAAFTSTDDMMRLYFPSGPPGTLSRTKYDSASLIPNIRVPILFIHGEYDYTIPMSMAKELYGLARTDKEFYVVRSADHNNTYFAGGSEYYQRINAFIEFCINRKNKDR